MEGQTSPNAKGDLIMKYYVVSKFFDNGKVKAEILTESEMSEDIKTETKGP
jgi:hypothetical protein